MSETAVARRSFGVDAPLMRRIGGAWWLWLALGSGASLAAYNAELGGEHGQSIVYQITGATSALALAVGATRRARGERRGWMLLSIGVLLFSAGDAMWDFYYGWFLNRTAPMPSSADALYLAGYPLVISGIALVVPSRRVPLRDLLDIGVLTASAGGLMWFIWISPQLHATGVGTQERVVSAGYPMMDVLVIAVLIYAAFAARTWPTYMRLLVTAFTFMLIADLVYYGAYADNSLVSSGWLVNYLLLAGAALHPGGIRSAPVRSSFAHWTRFALVAGAALLMPAALLVDAISGTTITAGYAPAAFALAIVLLVILRMAMLLQEQKVRERERAKLLQRSVQGAEEERRRVARDLHDGPIQALAAIVLKLDLLSRRLARERGNPPELLDEIRNDVAAEIVSLRRVMTDLRPRLLDDRGLVVALTDCARTVLDGSGIECSVRAALDRDHVAQEVESAIYRVTREALINVRKHAQAHHADVLLEPLDGGLHLVVRDDGIGFEQRPGRARDAVEHLGLVAMEESVASLGGTWTVRSVTGAGTAVEAMLPLRPA